MTDYYDSLSPEEADELRAWGEFAMCEFPAESTPPYAEPGELPDDPGSSARESRDPRASL